MQNKAFQNTDFSRLKCQLKWKKVDTACLRFSKFQPTKEWVNKVNLSSFLQIKLFPNLCLRDYLAKSKTSHVTIMFTYSHVNTPLSQSERAYYLIYYIKYNIDHDTRAFIQHMIKYITVCGYYNQKSYNEAVAMMHLKGSHKHLFTLLKNIRSKQSRESPHKG